MATDTRTSSAAPSGGARPAPGAFADGVDRSLRRMLLTAAGSAVAIWLLVLVAWPDAPFALTFDDAYYYFGIARNIAAGHGSTFDQINATNGYHPLWMLICIVPFKLGLDDLTAARVLLAVQIVLGWGGALAILAVVVDRATDHWRRGLAPLPARRGEEPFVPPPALSRRANVHLVLVFLAIALNPFLLKVFANGLESGIAVVLYALLLLMASSRYRQAVPRRRRANVGGDGVDDPAARTATATPPLDGWVVGSTRSWRLRMAALLAVVFLARTDAVILFGCLALWCVAEAAWARRHTGLSTGAAAGALAELFALPTLTVVVYLAANFTAFGTPLQVSGLIKRASPEPVALLLLLVLVAGAGAVGRLAFQRTHGRAATRPARFPHAGDAVRTTGWFAAFGILVVGYYNVLQTQQWLWYYCPVVLYLLLLFLLAVADMTEVALQTPPPGDARRALVIVGAIFLLPLGAGLAYQLGGFTDPTLLSIQQANRDTGELIRGDVPEDAVLASWDAGVVGYFSHRRVMNIDGVVNSKAFYDATRGGTVASFLRCRRVGYIVNHGAQVDGRDPDIEKLIEAVYGPDARRDSTILHAVPFVYSGTTNTGGFDLGGERELSVDVYDIPPSYLGPLPTDYCPPG